MLTSKFDSIHHGRRPELLTLKRAKMSSSPASFYRGSATLWYEYITSKILTSPNGWICGDLHCSNFGTFRGLDREIYFDINDFDEAVFGPIHRDLARLLSSIAVIWDQLGKSDKYIRDYITKCYHQYIDLLVSSSNGGIYPPSSTELDIDEEDIKESIRNQRKFISSVTDHHMITIDDEFILLEPANHTLIADSIKQLLQSMSQSNIIDITRHVSGNASLGLERYMILVENATSEHQYLLNLKLATESVAQPFAPTTEHFEHEAQRIVSIQKIMQDTSPLWLTAIAIGDQSYVLKEVQPVQNTVDLTDNMSWNKREKHISQMIYVMVASQIRSSDIIGSYRLDQLLEYAKSLDNQTEIIECACDYVQINKDYHQQLQQEISH